MASGVLARPGPVHAVAGACIRIDPRTCEPVCVREGSDWLCVSSERRRRHGHLWHIKDGVVLNVHYLDE